MQQHRYQDEQGLNNTDVVLSSYDNSNNDDGSNNNSNFCYYYPKMLRILHMHEMLTAPTLEDNQVLSRSEIARLANLDCIRSRHSNTAH